MGGQRLLARTLLSAVFVTRCEEEGNENGELNVLALLVYICIIKYMYIRARANITCKHRPVLSRIYNNDRQEDNQFSTELGANYT